MAKYEAIDMMKSVDPESKVRLLQRHLQFSFFVDSFFKSRRSLRACITFCAYIIGIFQDKNFVLKSTKNIKTIISEVGFEKF